MIDFTHIATFDYYLPENLIAQTPLINRSESKLLYLSANKAICQHGVFSNFCSFLSPGDLLVLNDTKVIPARLHGKKSTGGKVSALVERITAPNTALVHLKSTGSPKKGDIVYFSAYTASVLEKTDAGLLSLQFDTPILDILHEIGETPLPPYIKQKTQNAARYQTVYAKNQGAVAAPTAGLHFTESVLEKLEQQGVQIVYTTLHVGAGTFQPVRVENIDQHTMHYEYAEVSDSVCQAVQKTRERGGRIVAVGTTTLRALETACQEKGVIQPFSGETNLFIRPGYTFHSADMLLTNFHLPKSTLLMLVAAFGGYAAVMQAYQEAIDKAYRFFSFGDAMLIERTS